MKKPTAHPDGGVARCSEASCTARTLRFLRSGRLALGGARDGFFTTSEGFQAFGEDLDAVRTGGADAESRLMALLAEQRQPAIARATAAELGAYVTHRSFPFLADALADADPLVRACALQALDRLPVERRWQVAHDLLRDPRCVVWVLAAEALAATPASRIPPAARHAFDQAAAGRTVRCSIHPPAAGLAKA